MSWRAGRAVPRHAAPARTARPAPARLTRPLNLRPTRRLMSFVLQVIPTSMVKRRNEIFMKRLQHLLARWDACPGARKEIEGLLASRIADRVRTTWVSSGTQRQRQRCRPACQPARQLCPITRQPRPLPCSITSSRQSCSSALQTCSRSGAIWCAPQRPQASPSPASRRCTACCCLSRCVGCAGCGPAVRWPGVHRGLVQPGVSSLPAAS